MPLIYYEFFQHDKCLIIKLQVALVAEPVDQVCSPLYRCLSLYRQESRFGFIEHANRPFPNPGQTHFSDR